jgi:hypothetical protein
LMVGSLIVGTTGAERGSGLETKLILDIEAVSLESIARVALEIARFAKSKYTSQLSASVAYSVSFIKPWVESSKLSL